MTGKNGMKKKIYRMTYDRAVINKKAMRLKKSLDEVKKLLGQGKKK